MTVGVVKELGDALDGLAVTETGGSHSITFSFVEYGDHFDDDNWGTAPGVITARALSNPTTPTNIGGGAELNEENIDIIVLFEHDADIVSLDQFKRDVANGVRDVIRSNENGLVDSTSGGVTTTNYFLSVRNVQDTSDLVYGTRKRSSVLRNQLNITVRALGAAHGWSS